MRDPLDSVCTTCHAGKREDCRTRNFHIRSPHAAREEAARQEARAMIDDFADPGGRSALRRASKQNPRNLPCPTCKKPNRLTPADARRGYQCNSCADRDEGLSPQW